MNIYYPIYSIQYRDLNKHGAYMVRVIKDTEKKKEKTAVFIIKPDIRNDIYKLYCNDNVFYSYADIPNIKTSMFMNSIFRIIKENNNIDLIEESDNEEEFEITSETKYIKEIDTIYIECIFNEKFKSWVPNKVVKKTLLETKNKIKEIELS